MTGDVFDLFSQLLARPTIRNRLLGISTTQAKRQRDSYRDTAEGETKRHIENIISKAHRSWTHHQHEAENREAGNISNPGATAAG